MAEAKKKRKKNKKRSGRSKKQKRQKDWRRYGFKKKGRRNYEKQKPVLCRVVHMFIMGGGSEPFCNTCHWHFCPDHKKVYDKYECSG